MIGLLFVINVALDIAWAVIIAHVIMSWLIQFEVLNMRQPAVAKAWFGLERILEPVYAPIRKLLPSAGGIDFTPLIVLVGLAIIRSMVPGPGLF